MTMNTYSCRQQRGAVLMVSLMLLLIMTLLGLAAMNTTTMEEKMASNNQVRQQSFQGAETALRDAEAWLAANVNTVADLAQFNGTNGLFALERPTPGAPLAPPTFDIFDDTVWPLNGTQSLNLLPNQTRPRYIIEYLGKFGTGGAPLDPNAAPTPARYAFRITAIGWGTDDTARFLAWSHFARRLN